MSPLVETAGFLLLEDGTLFRGVLHGTLAATVAEVVFTTNMVAAVIVLFSSLLTDVAYTVVDPRVTLV